MNKKQLIEKKAHLISLMEQMVNKATVETRELDETETSVYEQLKEEVKKIADQLQELISEEAQTEETQDEKGTEERSMKDTMINELLSGNKIELRAMSTANTGNAVATHLYDEITRKVQEKSNIVAEAKTVSVVGDMEFLAEGAIGEAAFVGETDSVSPTDLSAFEKVKLTDKRVATMVLVSKKLLNNSPAVSESYIADIVATRVANALEKEILADAPTETNGFTHTLVSVADADKQTGALSIESLMALVTSMKSAHQSGAKMIMSRATFAKVAALKDASGRHYIVSDFNHATQGVSYAILGVEISISEYIADDKILFVNMQEAGMLKVADGIELHPLTEKYAEQGQIGILCNAYFDFAVLNKEAVKMFVIGA